MSDMNSTEGEPESGSIFGGTGEGAEVVSIQSIVKKRGTRSAEKASADEVASAQQNTREGKKAEEIARGKKKLAKLVQQNALELPSPEQPVKVADRLLAVKWRKDGRSTLAHWNKDFYEWTGPRWVRMTEDALDSRLQEYTRDAYCIKVVDDEEIAVEWTPNNRKIAELVSALRRSVHQNDLVDGSWLDGRVTSERYLSCANGLLRLRDRELLPHTPEYFNLFALDGAYTKDATSPLWSGFLDDVWTGDPESRLALQQWFAYILSGRMDLEKILMILGPTGSGKGVIADTLRALVGEENTAGPSLSRLAQNFGLETLIGKPLAIIGDGRLEGRGAGEIIERLLSISGRDKMDVDRKNKIAWVGVLPTRLMLLTNEMPNLADSANALSRRFRILVTPRSAQGREDKTLKERLRGEVAGILNWALDGMALLEEYGDILQPSSSSHMVELQKRGSSPFGSFLADCCVTGDAADWVSKEELRKAWKDWCSNSGYNDDTENDASFGRKLASTVPVAKGARRRVGGDGQRIPGYSHIRLDLDKLERADRESDEQEAMTLGYDGAAQMDLGIPGLLDPEQTQELMRRRNKGVEVVLEKGDQAFAPIARSLLKAMESDRRVAWYPGTPAGLIREGVRLQVGVPEGGYGPAEASFDRMFRHLLHRSEV